MMTTRKTRLEHVILDFLLDWNTAAGGEGEINLGALATEDQETTLGDLLEKLRQEREPGTRVQTEDAILDYLKVWMGDQESPPKAIHIVSSPSGNPTALGELLGRLVKGI